MSDSSTVAVAEPPQRPTMAEFKKRLLEASSNGIFPGQDAGGFCTYVSEDRKHKCAIGLFIPEDIAKGMQGSVLYDDNWEKVKPFLPEDLSLDTAYEIQRTHDKNVNPLSRKQPWIHKMFETAINRILHNV